jgi:hypothetical protein
MKKGTWIVNSQSFDGWKHHMCSVCKKDAVFEYRYVSDYDEGFDGEWEYVGKREAGINEHLTDYCPHCGADMNK